MFVSIGQGGNQLAACFWQRAHQHRQAHIQATPTPKSTASSRSTFLPPVSPFFAFDGYAHAIILDAEPKVVGKLAQLGEDVITTQTMKVKGKASAAASSASVAAASTSAPPASSVFRPTNFFYEQYGRGNNWAMGYLGREGSEGAEGSLLSDTLNAIRQEAERMDLFDSIVMMHSLAGGTGSGLGSRVTEAIREEYAKQFILSVCLGPFGTGDTPLQHYNSLLCLSHLYPVVDGLILASNADIARALGSHAMKPMSSSSSSVAPAMSFAGINTYLSACLADVLAPTRTLKSLREQDQEDRSRTTIGGSGEVGVMSSSSSSGPPLLASTALQELITSVAPLPQLKMMEIWSSAGLGQTSSAAHVDPKSERQPSWQGCMSALKRFVPPDDEDRVYEPRSIGYAVYARGDSLSDPIHSLGADLSTRFRKLFPHVSWNPYPMDLITTNLPRMRWTDPRTPSSLDLLKSEGRSAMKESTRSLAVCVNRSRTAHTLQPVVDKARILLENKAYLHWVSRQIREEKKL